MIAVLRFLWFPGLVVAVTCTWIWLDSVMGWRGLHMPRVGTLLLVAGSALAAWCAVLFYHVGRGSPNPFAAKTRRMVITGPYRVVRNPMMWGIGAILVGLALLLGSVGLWFGFSLFVLFVVLFVPGYEERDMERRFGEEYREYCRRVPRWWPRWRK